MPGIGSTPVDFTGDDVHSAQPFKLSAHQGKTIALFAINPHPSDSITEDVEAQLKVFSDAADRYKDSTDVVFAVIKDVYFPDEINTIDDTFFNGTVVAINDPEANEAYFQQVVWWSMPSFFVWIISPKWKICNMMYHITSFPRSKDYFIRALMHCGAPKLPATSIRFPTFVDGPWPPIEFKPILRETKDILHQLAIIELARSISDEKSKKEITKSATQGIENSARAVAAKTNEIPHKEEK